MSSTRNNFSPDEIARALALTYSTVKINRNFYADRDQGGYTLAVQVLQRMCAARRLDIVMAYAEADKVVCLGGEVIAPPVVATRDAMVCSLLQLHHAFGILNHWIADAMDHPEFVEKQWAVTPEITPDVDFNVRSPIIFRIDPVQAERLARSCRRQTEDGLVCDNAVMLELPALVECSERVERMLEGGGNL